jgi:hypothetical protein
MMVAHKVLANAVVIETENGCEVRLVLRDPHTAGCKSCMAVMALRMSTAFLEAIDRLEQEADEAASAAPESEDGAIHLKH